MLRYLTKSAPTLKFAPPEAGVMRRAHVKFRPASDVELKALGDDLPDGYVAGWASTKDLDAYRHRVQPGAFQESISARGLSGPKGVKLLINHDWTKPAGVIKKLEYRNGDLWIEAQMNLEISYARDMYQAAKMQGGLSFSVGFMLDKYSVEGDSDQGGEWLRIDKGDLFEVSVVPFPANEEATMTFIKGLAADVVEPPDDLATVAEFEKHIIAAGIALSRNEARRLTQVVKANIALFQKEPGGTPAAPPAPLNPPVLAAEKLLDLKRLAEQMKQTLAS